MAVFTPAINELDACRAHARSCRYCRDARGCNEAHRLYLAYLTTYSQEVHHD